MGVILSCTSRPRRREHNVDAMGHSELTGHLQPTSHSVSTHDDPVRYLNNRLQGHPRGNLTPYLSWVLGQTGPDHQKTHHATAKCESVNVIKTRNMC